MTPAVQSSEAVCVDKACLEESASIPGRPTVVHQPWDIIGAEETMDLTRRECQEAAELLDGQAAIAHYSPSCKTFSAVREIPIKGVRKAPGRLRSHEHPDGVPFLNAASRAHLKKKVDTDNMLASWTFRNCRRRHQAGLGFTVENPASSYIWDTKAAKELKGMPGVETILLHNCMFAPGLKRKCSRFDTNMPQLRKRLERTCSAAAVCDRTGQAHESWRPVVKDGLIIRFPSAAEAEFQAELCDQLVQGYTEFIENMTKTVSADFIEFFAGPRAPLTNAMRAARIQVSSETVVIEDACEAIPSSVGPTSSGLVKVGAWGMTLVRQDHVMRPGRDAIPFRPPAALAMRDTKKSIREKENASCIGGLRSPWKKVQGWLQYRKAGLIINGVLASFLSEYPGMAEELLDGGQGFTKYKDVLETVLVDRVAAALGAECTARGPRSRWRPQLVEKFVEMSGDPETHLSTWLRDGAPTGVASEIPYSGIFPKVEDQTEAGEDIQRIFAKAEKHKNYVSVQDNKTLVAAELERLTSAGFMTKVGSWTELVRELGDVVVNKMACIIKEKEDGTVKLRLITDMLRSRVNEFVKLNERLVLPRICDALEAALSLLELAQSNAEDDVEMMVSDFADAFHSMGVHPSERRHQVVAGMDGQYHIYETVVFGGGGSPLIWGRGAAFLSRSGQALFDSATMRLETFVDDPWSVWRGNTATRHKNMAILLLWWLSLGLDLSWHKIVVGKDVRWIGAGFEIQAKAKVRVFIPEKFCSDLAAEARVMLTMNTVAATAVRAFTGRASWAGGIVPCLASILQPCWAALADVAREPDTPEAWRAKKKVKLLPAALTVPTVRVAHSLEWMVAFLTGQAGTISKTFPVGQRRLPTSVIIVTDASPWGLGGFILVCGLPFAWFSEELSAEDIARFGIIVGNPKWQALVENLALLVAVRMWLPLWKPGRLGICLRSDSMAALGAWKKERSSSPDINAVVREMSLDLAEWKYNFDSLEHLPGKLNDWADSLSRLQQPGSDARIPRELIQVRRFQPQSRGDSWWRLGSRPVHG